MIVFIYGILTIHVLRIGENNIRSRTERIILSAIDTVERTSCHTGLRTIIMTIVRALGIVIIAHFGMVIGKDFPIRKDVHGRVAQLYYARAGRRALESRL